MEFAMHAKTMQADILMSCVQADKLCEITIITRRGRGRDD